MVSHALVFPHSFLSVTHRLSSVPVTRSVTRSSARVKCSSLPGPLLADEVRKFKEAAEHGNLVPLCQSIFSDQLTPILAYRCLVKEDDRDAPSFLCESVEPNVGDSSVGRFSVVGA